MSSDSGELPAPTEQVHTPFCDDNCGIQHHPILQTLMHLPGILGLKDKAELSQCIERYIARGWNLDDPIPDPIPEFRFPMLHWVAALGKKNDWHIMVSFPSKDFEFGPILQNFTKVVQVELLH